MKKRRKKTTMTKRTKRSHQRSRSSLHGRVAGEVANEGRRFSVLITYAHKKKREKKDLAGNLLQVDNEQPAGETLAPRGKLDDSLDITFLICNRCKEGSNECIEQH